MSSQCTSGVPLKAVEEEDAVTMCVESDDGPWEEVVKGSRYPHMAEHILTLEHDATFQVFEDPDSGDDEQDDAVWLDDADEDLIRSSDTLLQCCLLA